MICEICERYKRKGDVISLLTRNVFVCEGCQKGVLLAGFRSEGVMIVPLKGPSLRLAIEHKIYVRPWKKKAKQSAFIAFYNDGKISYFSRVSNFERKVAKWDLPLIIPLCDDWGKRDYYSVYKLAYVEGIKRPLTRSKLTIQSKIIVTFKKFIAARSIDELMSKTDVD